MKPALKDKLQTLVQLLSHERSCARDLDMPGLQTVLQEKTALLSTVSVVSAAVDDEATGLLIGLLQQEIRRNASLYRSARRTLLGISSVRRRFAGGRGYGPQGNRVLSAGPKPLLSGKV